MEGSPHAMFSTPVGNPGFDVEGEGVLKEQMKTNREGGRSQTYHYAHSVKNYLIFQTANRVPSNKFPHTKISEILLRISSQLVIIF